MSRVFNIYGPRSEFGNTNISNSTSFIPETSHPIEERIQKLENGFGITKPVPKDVYARLKQIEDRLLQLESISPEYAQFWNNSSLFCASDKEPSSRTKRKYSIDDIDALLNNLEAKKSSHS